VSSQRGIKGAYEGKRGTSAINHINPEKEGSLPGALEKRNKEKKRGPERGNRPSANLLPNTSFYWGTIHLKKERRKKEERERFFSRDCEMV